MRACLFLVCLSLLVAAPLRASNDRLDWEAVVRGSYLNEDRDGLGGSESTRTELSNLRLRIYYKVSESLELRLRSDHRSGGDEIVSGDLLDAMFVLHMPKGGGDVKLGSFLVPVGRYHAAPIEDWEFVDQPIAYRAMGLATPLAPSAAGSFNRFLGEGNYDVLGIGRQRGALFEQDGRPGKLAWSVGLFDGDGNTGQGSDDRDLDSGRFLRVDLPKRALGRGRYEAAAWYWHGEQRSLWGNASNDLRGLYVEWADDRGLRALVEYVNSDVNVAGIPSVEAGGLLYQVIVPVLRDKKIDFLARNECWEVSDTGVGDWERTTLGLRWRKDEITSFQLEHWKEFFDSGSALAGIGSEPSTLVFQVMRRF